MAMQAKGIIRSRLSRNAEEVQRWMNPLELAGFRLEVDLGGGNYAPVVLRYDQERDMRLAQDKPAAE